MMENFRLKQAGAVWWYTVDWEGPNMSKASLGSFMYECISEGAQLGDFFCMNNKFPRSAIQVSLFMTEEMKNNIEARTKFRFKRPPKLQLNSGDNP